MPDDWDHVEPPKPDWEGYPPPGKPERKPEEEDKEDSIGRDDGIGDSLKGHVNSGESLQEALDRHRRDGADGGDSHRGDPKPKKD